MQVCQQVTGFQWSSEYISQHWCNTECTFLQQSAGIILGPDALYSWMCLNSSTSCSTPYVEIIIYGMPFTQGMSKVGSAEICSVMKMDWSWLPKISTLSSRFVTMPSDTESVVMSKVVLQGLWPCPLIRRVWWCQKLCLRFAFIMNTDTFWMTHNSKSWAAKFEIYIYI